MKWHRAVNAGGVQVRPWVWQPTGPLAHHNIESRTSARHWTDDIRYPATETRPAGTMITAKRCCNGCGARLGDVVDRDILDPMPRYGSGLADVREECPTCTVQVGCQLAVYEAETADAGPV